LSKVTRFLRRSYFISIHPHETTFGPPKIILYFWKVWCAFWISKKCGKDVPYAACACTQTACDGL